MTATCQQGYNYKSYIVSVLCFLIVIFKTKQIFLFYPGNSFILMYIKSNFVINIFHLCKIYIFKPRPRCSQLGDSCIQNFQLERYVIRNSVLWRRTSRAVKRDFRTYIQQYTSTNENVEYDYPHKATQRCTSSNKM